VSLDATLMQAGKLRRLCDVTLTDGSTAKVEPYAIYTSEKGRRIYLWFQVSSSDPNEPAGWKNQEANYVASAALAEESFSIRPDYNPLDKWRFPMMHFSIPTSDGRQRS